MHFLSSMNSTELHLVIDGFRAEDRCAKQRRAIALAALATSIHKQEIPQNSMKY